MKVKKLKTGMLLRATSDFLPKIEMEKCELLHMKNAMSFSKIQTMRFVYSPLLRLQRSKEEDLVFIYLGSKHDPYKWDGIYKHHRVLYEGAVLHLSGYDMRYVEAVS